MRSACSRFGHMNVPPGPALAGTDDLSLWTLIRQGTQSLSFPEFEAYVDNIGDRQREDRSEYEHVRLIATVFLTAHIGGADGLPRLELIWSYWQERGGLAGSIGAIADAFENRRTAASAPLAGFAIDPNSRVAKVLYGWVDNAPPRLTGERRVLEYEHEYGLTLNKPRVTPLRRRDRFPDAWRRLLTDCATFFAQDDPTSVIADGFPVLTALKDVNALLADGATNQCDELSRAAR